MDRLPRLPCECAICDVPGAAQLVPDRSVGTWRFDVMCPLCLDEFLGVLVDIFPRIQERELLGRFPMRRRRTHAPHTRAPIIHP